MTDRVSLRLSLDVWREVGRHTRIADSAQRIAALLAGEIPLERLIVRSVDLGEGRAETVGDGTPASAEAPLTGRTEWDPRETAAVRSWVAGGGLRAWRAAESDELRRLIAPAGLRGALIAGALAQDGEPLGIVLVQSGRDALLDGRDLVASLLEPIAAALANDRRLGELARLREAAEADNRALLSRLQREDISDSVVGAETGLRAVMERVEQVARTDAPVLILGETGSGKEVVARAIHSRSRRSKGPFLRINCGAIPSELVDSELFGHERGSFTGAVNARRGWFERADGGTLFLDELGELPAAAQVRLLRVLQDGSFERVGGQKTQHVDVRIVAATHRDMQDLVAAGRFRQDLWYRVNVFPVRLPPLRERVGDVAALATHFAARAGMRLHGVSLAPGPEDLALLAAYEWPGNVRELASVIERAAILGDGKRLEVATALGVDPKRAPIAAPAAPAAAPGAGAPRSLEAAQRQHIIEALERTLGRIEGPFGAAAQLGVNPHTLRSRMRKLGIEWSRYRQRDGTS